MHLVEESRAPSSVLARNALLISSTLAVAGSALGAFGILHRGVSRIESSLITSSLLLSTTVLVILLAKVRIRLEMLTTTFTVYYTVHLVACIVASLYGPSPDHSLFIYLAWFFPLLVFNRLVNAIETGQWLARVILASPLVTLAILGSRLTAVLSHDSWYLLIADCLSYSCFGLMLNVVGRYREAYILESERGESLRMEAQVLESISDCFISLDADFRLIYLNDAACSELSITREKLRVPVQDAVPAFFTRAICANLKEAYARQSSSVFEGQSENPERWYELRCFPRPDGISIYFRNITASVQARKELEAATAVLRERSKLLDKAQDAIFVQDMETRILYWNKGAERLFGWTAEEVIGKRVGDIFDHDRMTIRRAYHQVVQQGEWIGELPKRRKDGQGLIVESRCTLVRTPEGEPQSILVINTDISERKAAEARIHHLAFYDAVTGLPNRFFVREQLEIALKDTMEIPGALLLIDLDDFKTLNESSGHDTGDLLLKAVGHRVRSLLTEGQTLFRMGGDEFVVLVESASEGWDDVLGRARMLGEKILEASQEPFHLGKLEYHCTSSIGVTLLQRRDSVDDVFKRAELALYQAKADGRNAVCLFDPSMEARVENRAALRADIVRALQNHEFELHYQPQVDRNGAVVAAESLLRWPHPERGMVPPSEFIPLAEDAGLIGELGSWVLETACTQLAAWATVPHLADIDVAVNVSMLQFLDSQFVQTVKDVLLKTGVDPRRLKLEITETIAMEQANETVAKITALRKIGVGFSLDDFGTGYSSLSQLKRLPLDQLKIDRSFVRDALSGPLDLSILRTIISLGKNLNLRLIAEGIETEEQWHLLESEGCDACQGFLFSRALPTRAFEAFVAANLQPGVAVPA